MSILVLGMGNLLLADEGVGVHAANALISKGMPAGVTVLDIGTAILDALPDIEKADKVIIVDAVKAGLAAGTIYRLDHEDCQSNPCIASMHGFDLTRVVALSQRKALPEVVIIGVEPQRIEWSLELSPALKEAMPAVIKSVEEEIAGTVLKSKQKCPF